MQFHKIAEMIRTPHQKVQINLNAYIVHIDAKITEV
mgnify:CR=1 FL=1